MRKRSRIAYITAGLLVLLVFTVFICNALVERAASGKTYANVEDVPFNKVGLLLGTSKTLAGGLINPYYRYRVMAAVELWKNKKIHSIIVSGDNSTSDYNEPADFKEDLIKQGVDSNHIYLDYAGFRTFDSMVRLKKIFGQDSVTVISQKFHNERALYIAKREGILAVGLMLRMLAYSNVPGSRPGRSWPG